jgi:hypothetical protein
MSWNANTIRSAKHASTGRFTFFPLLLFVALVATRSGQTQTAATDPGVRGGPAGAGRPIAGLTDSQKAFYMTGLAEFLQLDSVKGAVPNTGAGLGPRFNAESCGQCHAQPAIGGTSPSTNPQIAAATDQGATNLIPFFIATNGPVREAWFPYQSDLPTAESMIFSQSRAAATPRDAIFRSPTFKEQRTMAI